MSVIIRRDAPLRGISSNFNWNQAEIRANNWYGGNSGADLGKRIVQTTCLSSRVQKSLHDTVHTHNLLTPYHLHSDNTIFTIS